MFNCEMLVQERTGHRTVKALRMHQRTSTSQHKAVFNVLVSPQEVQYKDASQPAVSGTFGSGSLTLLVRTASHCVININFGSRIDGTKESNVIQSVERACSKTEVDI